MGGHRLQPGVRQPAAARRRLADLLGRKVTFLAGLAGFAGVSAIGGASVSFAMLITARACQGAFAALLVPSALSLLTTTFTGPKDLLRPGPLRPASTPPPAHAEATTAQAKADPALPG